MPSIQFNPLNTKLNPICHLLALLGAHPILHVTRIRVKHNTENIIFLSVNLTTSSTPAGIYRQISQYRFHF